MIISVVNFPEKIKIFFQILNSGKWSQKDIIDIMDAKGKPMEKAHCNSASVNYDFVSKENLYVEAWKYSFAKSI